MSRFSRPHLTLLLVCSLSAPVPLAAQLTSADPLTVDRVGRMNLRELIEQEVVSAAARYDQRPAEAGSAVTIVTAQEIEQFGYRTIQDVLSAVRGFYVTYDRNYSYLGVRGISPPGDYNARVLVQVDGHRINENTYDGVYIGTDSLIDLGIVDRVEIVHGPGSSLYGSNAVFAVVNFVTRSNTGQASLQLEGDLGSLGTHAGRMQYAGATASGVDLLFSASRYASDGHNALFFPELASSTPSGGWAHKGDRDGFDRVFGKVARQGLTVQGAFSDRRKGVPTGAFATVFDDPRSETIDRRGFLTVKYHSPAERPTQINATVALDRYVYDGSYPTDYGDATAPDVLVNHDYARGTWFTTEWVASRRVGTQHHVVGGLEYRDNWQVVGNADRVVYTDIHARTRVAGLFAQDEWKLQPWLALVLGLRHDRYPSFGGTTNPRLAAVITATAHTTAKLTYGHAFRPPNIAERSDELAPVAGYVAGRINPESVRTTEAVLEHRRDRFLGGEAWFSLSGYRNDLRDLIATDVIDGWSHARNVGSARVTGVEVEARARWAHDITMRGSVSVQRAGEHNGAWLANTPGELASARLHVPWRQDRLGVAVQSTFIAARLSSDGTKVPASTTSDVTLAWKPAGTHLTLSANVRNLFNRTVYAPTSDALRQSLLQLDGRTIYLNTRWHF